MDKGTNNILQIKVSGTYYPIGCLTSNSFSDTSEMLDTTTRDNDGWETSKPTSQSYNISFGGLITFDNISSTVITFRDIQDLKREKTLVEWKIENSTDGYYDTGSGYITSLSDEAPIDEFISFSGEIVGVGQPELETRAIITATVSTSTTVTVTTVATKTDDTLSYYNVYSSIMGLLSTMTPAEAAAGKSFTIATGYNHDITAKAYWTTAGLSTIASNRANVDLT